MKLPKGFGGQGFGGMMRQAQEAMARAQTLEQELALERILVDKGQVKVEFTGTGELVKISIDPSIVDPDDVEGLETMIETAVREGFTKATDLRNSKVQEIMPNIPGM
ncbi:MAG TPA: YbaB/EbfC family nucleoid-associated protein [Fimbriimonadaceae bacterium]|nr:YbaB/EbfC family nucleoid-associated protein [Fimbriimonadaceae bacterium]